MAKLRHIALSVPDPWKAAEFYMSAFGMTKVGETDSSLAVGVYLSDGVINLALLHYKSDEMAGEDRGKDFVGLHHIGFWVDDADAARRQVEAAGAKYWMGEVPKAGNSFYELKFRDPNGIVFDISAHGWGGASKDGAAKAKSPALRHEDLVADRSALKD
jgi:catechol 2,3-dioxygenase-like lactoylglutathione lyase family enzyme